ncbi:hypothetical protein ET495_10395 [Xylanimonas allomyrinae]|uniref:Uncharacterized protein n=1 Tax=Xylanimonas allomyrinae TaxID=2509459 RepID=A0A4P6ELD0_9MICO|nr:hypothetical protein [Xylanimonas allomyrinae]QAY63590.1 hypothetical protein ET495_10395 [Xylanimonas allomyrinae]
MGEADGGRYTLKVRDGAPAPQADLRFATQIDDVGKEHGLTLGPDEPVVPEGCRTASVTATAPAGPPTDGTPVTVRHTVSSGDPAYDGLVVEPAQLLLFSAEPRVTLTKRAFAGVTDQSTPQRIIATGTELQAGAQIGAGTPVWFVFEVRNTSSGTWATSLNDVQVHDDVLGDIGTVATLAQGKTALLGYGPHLMARAGGTR